MFSFYALIFALYIGTMNNRFQSRRGSSHKFSLPFVNSVRPPSCYILRGNMPSSKHFKSHVSRHLFLISLWILIRLNDIRKAFLQVLLDHYQLVLLHFLVKSSMHGECLASHSFWIHFLSCLAVCEILHHFGRIIDYWEMSSNFWSLIHSLFF